MKHTAELSPHISAGLEIARELKLPCVAMRNIPINAQTTDMVSYRCGFLCMKNVVNIRIIIMYVNFITVPVAALECSIEAK